jgi:hypothetical protein
MFKIECAGRSEPMGVTTSRELERAAIAIANFRGAVAVVKTERGTELYRIEPSK